MRVYGKKTGNLIRSRRSELKMSQETLTKKLGWSGKNSQYISSCELGKNPFPVKHINSLCLSIDVSRDKIINAMIEDFRDCLELEVNK